PDARADRERSTGIVRVYVNLDRSVVADDEQRVAEPVELRLEGVAAQVGALDEEDRAVLETRQLLVDRLEAEMLLHRGRLRDRLAADERRDSAHELEQTCTARVDDARVAEHLALLGSARDRLLAAPN